MKRLIWVALLLAPGGGCMSADGGMATGVYMSQAFNHQADAGPCVRTPVNAQNMVGPYGQPVAMTAPATVDSPMSGEALARSVIAQSLPAEIVQQLDYKAGRGSGSGLMQAQAVCPPGGCPVPPGMQAGAGGLPMMLPGGVAPPGAPGAPGGPPAAVAGAVAAVGALSGPAMPFGAQRTEIRFVEPKGMKISWFAPKPDGKPGFGANFLDVPGRYNFLQAAIYRLKLMEIPGYPGLELYPTLEVVPANCKTATFLAHSAVPITFTQEDIDQVRAGNYVVKVIYLPDPQFQDLVVTGPDEVVSSRLEPGVDPITEALRRGSILAVVRLGNIDLEAPNTPAMDAPGPAGMMGPGCVQGPGGMMMPNAAMAGRMGPYQPMMNGPMMNGRQPMMPNPYAMQQGQPMLPNPYAAQQVPTMLPPAMVPNGAAPTVPAIPPGRPGN
jgi:hypothetical protein